MPILWLTDTRSGTPKLWIIAQTPSPPLLPNLGTLGTVDICGVGVWLRFLPLNFSGRPDCLKPSQVKYLPTSC